MRNRLFLFGNAELLRQERSASAAAFTPTAAMFEGDFSELGRPIFNPFRFNPSTGQREQFPSNRIPEEMINPVSRELLEFYCSLPDSLRCDPEAIQWPQFSQGIFVSASEGRSNFHALNVKYNHQFLHGFSVLGNYTFGKVIDSVGGLENGNQRGNARRDDRGPAAFNRKHLLTLSALWELPFGRGRSVGGDVGALLNAFIGGWQISAIGTFASGVPVTVRAPNRTPANVVNFRADRLCPGDVKVDGVDLRQDLQYLDPACFAEPAAGFFGSAGTGIVTTPGINNWDLSIGKDVTVHEDVRLRFQADFFNAFNHTQFGGPVTNVAAENFGQVTTARDARQIQLGLRLLW